MRMFFALASVISSPEARAVEAIGRKPGQRYLRLRIECGVEFVLDLFPDAIDERECGFHRHGAVVVFKHLGVTRKHAHARANYGLLHVHRADAGLADVVDRVRQFALRNTRMKSARVIDRSIRCALAADKHNGGGESIGALAHHSAGILCSDWPSAVDCQARIMYCLEK